MDTSRTSHGRQADKTAMSLETKKKEDLLALLAQFVTVTEDQDTEKCAPRSFPRVYGVRSMDLESGLGQYDLRPPFRSI